MSDLGVILIFAGVVVGLLALDAFWDPGSWTEKLDAAYPTKPDDKGAPHEC